MKGGNELDVVTVTAYREQSSINSVLMDIALFHAGGQWRIEAANFDFTR
ncbi:hypothetical protein BH23BAC3_BH23BAC3_06640 [soil metagenome]